MKRVVSVSTHLKGPEALPCPAQRCLHLISNAHRTHLPDQAVVVAGTAVGSDNTDENEGQLKSLSLLFVASI